MGDWWNLSNMVPTAPDDSGDSSFSFLLDMFLAADQVVFFSEPSHEAQANRIMEEMAAGRLKPDEVQELLGSIRSDPSSVACLAALLHKTKSALRE